MKALFQSIIPVRAAMILAFVVTLFVLGATTQPQVMVASAEANSGSPRVYVPYWSDGTPYPSRSVFWFGKVGPYDNYVDVRMIFHDDRLRIATHVVDRTLYQSQPQSGVDLTQWDAISVFLQVGGNGGATPDADSYRFDVQLGQWGEPAYSQRAYRGGPGGWQETPVAFTASASWRGDNGPNSGGDDKGWTTDYTIPFQSLGLSSRPESGTVWQLAVAMHDRDSFNQPATTTHWPENMNENTPDTWGEMSFGWFVYDPPLLAPDGEVTIRQGLNGTIVPDADVGGHTTCGDGVDHWSEWGNTNYAGNSQINVQNQWDISDYPCFSKYYVTFPLDAVPTGPTIINATVTLYLFGNAGYDPGDAQPSGIQALTVADDWDEQTITWNNAPPALGNIAIAWVDPVDGFDPGVAYTWDVSQAVADAKAAGTPLRLAFYSADGEYHSGKYFWSSNSAVEVSPETARHVGQPAAYRKELPAVGHPQPIERCRASCKRFETI